MSVLSMFSSLLWLVTRVLDIAERKVSSIQKILLDNKVRGLWDEVRCKEAPPLSNCGDRKAQAW